ncbi:MAG: efflux RND transporter periplasmic adaptor subunit [Paracoccaceae bacterium]
MSPTHPEPAVPDTRATSLADAETGGPHLPAVRNPQPTEASPPPKSNRRPWLWIGAGLGVAALGLILWLQPWVPKAAAVGVEIVALAPVTRVLAVNGRIAARQSVNVRPLISGTLADLQVTEGNIVQTGAELARIDATAQQAMLRQAVAGMDAALVAQAQAEDGYARTKALGANVARTALDAAERAVQTAAQDVARTAALVDQAQAQLANFTIRAPMTGTVLALNVDPGQSIDPSTVLMTLADLSQLLVETDVDEAYATQIRAGQPAVLQLAGETTTREGRVSLVSQRVDPATGGLAVKLGFDAAVTAPVGLTVTANIIVDSQGAALTVPRAAIQSTDDGQVVFIVIDDTARRRAVSVIDWPAGRLIVTDGLSPGDVLIRDATGITDGQPVRVETP